MRIAEEVRAPISGLADTCRTSLIAFGRSRAVLEDLPPGLTDADEAREAGRLIVDWR